MPYIVFFGWGPKGSMLVAKNDWWWDKNGGIFFSHIFLIVIFPQQSIDHFICSFSWVYILNLDVDLIQMDELAECCAWLLYSPWFLYIYKNNNSLSLSKKLFWIWTSRFPLCLHLPQSLKSCSTFLYNTISSWKSRCFTQLVLVHTSSVSCSMWGENADYLRKTRQLLIK